MATRSSRSTIVRIASRRTSGTAAGADFDLVIGAGGLRSPVRRLTFGPQERFEKKLGYMVAAFEVGGYRPRDPDAYVVYCEPGRQLARLALHGDRTLFLFVFVGDADVPKLDLSAQKAVLRQHFGAGKWETVRILAELSRAQDIYFDRVDQVVMERWSKGRVALIGDAAFCISLLGGQGAALAMTAAYVLAGELAKCEGEYQTAFRNYEDLLRSFIVKKQRAAERFAGAFAPRTGFGLFLRNQALRAFRIPGLARFAIGRDIADTLALPNYSFAKMASA